MTSSQNLGAVPSQGGGTVEIHVLGQRLRVKAGDDPKHVERVAAYVKRKMDELSGAGPVSSSKLAALTALNIADDYFSALEELRQLRQQVSSKTHVLLGELEQVQQKISR